MLNKTIISLFLLLAMLTQACVRETPFAELTPRQRQDYIAAHYQKHIFQIPMRDGVKLHTIVYTPKDQSQTYPLLINRTPYGIAPYEADSMPALLGPSPHFAEEKYIFVYQDVRGRFMSEGEFVNMRPLAAYCSTDSSATDEATDAWDTIEWLLRNIKNNNGKAGIWGISYPGFYAACTLSKPHPALCAVSPQAPIADWFWDDFHHHGAFFLPHFFHFFQYFGVERQGLTSVWPDALVKEHTPDGYRFFLEMGPLRNIDSLYYKGRVAFWNQLAQHPDYDTFWQERNLLPHLTAARPAVLVVAGLFDAENLYGGTQVYQAIERQNPKNDCRFVFGPWRHGGWARDDGRTLGDVCFGQPTSDFYQQHVEESFFTYYLKGKGTAPRFEALVFQTGANRWRTFDTWPPALLMPDTLYFAPDGSLPREHFSGDAFREFVSNPHTPVPYTTKITQRMEFTYMTEDQRFASQRPDVLTYISQPLTRRLSLAGPLAVRLIVSTNQGDADWVLKLIDVYPDHARACTGSSTPDDFYPGFQQMVRSEAFRGRYRHSYTRPEPFSPSVPDTVAFNLPDVCHTFKKGHRLMIQVQSTWFPLMDRNPQKYVGNIYEEAVNEDFTSAIHRLYSGSYLVLPVLLDTLQ